MVYLSDCEEDSESVSLTNAERKDTSTSVSAPVKKLKSSTVLEPQDRPSPFATPLLTFNKASHGTGFGSETPRAHLNTPTTTPSRPTAKTKPATSLTSSQPTRKSYSNTSSSPGKRKAAAAVQSKVQQIFQADEQFLNEEQARTNGPSTTDLGARLRSMSITPIPTHAGFGASKDTPTAQAPTKANTAAAAAETKNAAYSSEKSHRDRLKAYWLAARKRGRNVNTLIDEDSDEDYEKSDVSSTAAAEAETKNTAYSREKSHRDRLKAYKLATRKRGRNINTFMGKDSDEDYEESDVSEYNFLDGMVVGLDGKKAKASDWRMFMGSKK